jgi:hypothetical protein
MRVNTGLKNPIPGPEAYIEKPPGDQELIKIAADLIG